MTTKHLARLGLFLVTNVAAGMCQAAFAQEPSPAAPAHNVPTFVYLKQDYVDALKPGGLVRDNPVTAVFVRFDNDFAVFKRPESNALVYVPKSAVLYISAKPDPAFSLKY